MCREIYFSIKRIGIIFWQAQGFAHGRMASAQRPHQIADVQARPGLETTVNGSVFDPLVDFVGEE